MAKLDAVEKRILVTGGSGFIGTNLVDELMRQGIEVLNLDVKGPQCSDQNKVFKKGSILDYLFLQDFFQSFRPTHVIHLAARTDLAGTCLDDYAENTNGVSNLVRVVSDCPSVQRCIFTSTKLVCPTDYSPVSDEDYCPDTYYGESKVVGEGIVKSSTTLKASWCIVRPTSIWGPWSYLPHIPYGRFFQMIGKGHYFHPGNINPPKSFGYVGNSVFQLLKLLDAPKDQIHKRVFYLSDYEVFTIKDWANQISIRLRNKEVKMIPEPLVYLLAWCGDVLKSFGMKEPPLSTFRLRNMRADTSGVPLDSMKSITDTLPYSVEEGVDETIAWLKQVKLL